MIIRAENLSKSYRLAAGEYRALHSVDLEIGASEMVAVTGKSGTGKSTLLNLIGGIDRPTAGSVTVGAANITGYSEGMLAGWRGRSVGFIFQFFQLLPTLTAAENVMLAMDFVGKIPVRHRRQRALELLQRFAVGGQADKFPSSLSGGEQQRVAIARALANDPPVILADEPTGNLDTATAAGVLGIFRQLSSEGTTVVIATHDREIAQASDRIVTLVDGMISDREHCAAEQVP